MIDELKRMLSDRDALREKLQKENDGLKEQKCMVLKVRKHLHGKGIHLFVKKTRMILTAALLRKTVPQMI